MEKLIGLLHEESYYLVHEVKADSYGYGDLTLEPATWRVCHYRTHEIRLTPYVTRTA